MPEPIDKPFSTEPQSPAGEPSAGRRRLLQGALASAPVLMTLISRPVLAQQCQTPSGFVSANASTAGRGAVCEGRSPQYWVSVSEPPHHEWPPGFPPPRLFDSVLAHNSHVYPGKKLLDVLKLQGGPPDDVARLVVAALLNAASGLTPVLSENAVKSIWSEYLNTASFSPSSGVHWNHDDIIAYLLTTMSA